ncbi:hypothetical protein [Sutcliffiella rhizosphaerae]|uniref:Integral membrane protein n=1 Tax=Sutcliffiella rhizosphaerae TaxID=2880967 RepID=A0ABM8YMW9_9BACI|nr:hypothetical protein [Sutcliffiella rhizosphaerae]CAG9621263.1 hypothetical protein BACCIP111883_02035 [Sutcliffiella rhizosphaerae]
MDSVVEYSWELFIIAEVLSVVSLLLFCVFRYFYSKPRFSLLFIFFFLLLLVLEALLGFYVYRQTGEFSTFLIVITIFVIYACTFGIGDFIRLDRWMRKKIGSLRGIELLSDKDYEIMEKNSDPKYIAKKYRISSFIHLAVFVIAQSIFWFMGTESISEMGHYLTDFSWLDEGTAEGSPYPNDTLFAIGVIWGIVFIVDFIYSWSYTLFPSKK